VHSSLRSCLACIVLAGLCIGGATARAQILYFVTNTNDSGPGSLRQAIADANVHAGADGIEFSLDFSTPKTILLQSGVLVVSDSLEIHGPGPDRLTIDGGGSARVFAFGPGTTASLDGHTIENGLGASGGGISNFGTLTISHCTIARNEATDDGGGIWNGGVLSLAESTIYDNVADDSAGGVYNRDTGVLTIRNSTIFANVVTGGGGGGLTNLGTATVVNSTISANLASRVSGGLDNGGTLALLNSTIAGNRPGGMDNDGGSTSVGNSIIADNLLGPDCSGLIDSAGHNIGSDATCFDPATVPSDRSSTDPRLVMLTDNGGPTLTHAPSPDSPAVDQGDNSLVPQGIATDQRGAGFPRVVNGVVDIGAVETQLSAATATGAVSVVQGGFRKNLVTGRYVQTSTLSNAGTSPVPGPVSLIIDNLTAGVSLFQPTGTATNGSPYKNASLGADGVLSPGESVTVTLEFVNPLAKTISYKLRVLAGPGPR
jgi:hypothetical protein